MHFFACLNHHNENIVQKTNVSKQSLVSRHENEDKFNNDNSNYEEVSIHSMLNTSVDVRRRNLSAIDLVELHRLESICRHNGHIAQSNGQPTKANVWVLLSKIVYNVATSGLFNDDFDGWGDSSGSLGKKIIENILVYYEGKGDVQMLATIVCVFTATKNIRRPQTQSYDLYDNADNHSSKDRASYSDSLCDLFLTPNDLRYDLYIKIYSNILYGWGQISRRTELRKHLSLIAGDIFGDEKFVPIEYENNESNTFDDACHFSNNDQASSMAFVPYCPKCHRPANPETNICNACHTYAFRCSICTNAVRGKFLVCFTCGHGGHLDHIMSWFKNNTVCPTGCGCTCTLSTFSPASIQEQQLDKSVTNAKLKRSVVMGNVSSSTQRRSIFGPKIQNHHNNADTPLMTIGYGSVPF